MILSTILKTKKQLLNTIIIMNFYPKEKKMTVYHEQFKMMIGVHFLHFTLTLYINKKLKVTKQIKTNGISIHWLWVYVQQFLVLFSFEINFGIFTLSSQGHYNIL